MKSILLLLMTTIVSFAHADITFFEQVQGKTIVGQSIENITTQYEFSADGKLVVLKKNTGYTHTFVKMIGDIAVYKGNRGGKVHYDAFQINDGGVLLTSSDQIGGVKLKPNTPEQIALELTKKGLNFTSQQK